MTLPLALFQMSTAYGMVIESKLVASIFGLNPYVTYSPICELPPKRPR